MGNTGFFKETFTKISAEKKDTVFTVAIAEFAALGFNAANINTIAQKAKISIGSLYSYFESKEDLFLAMAEKGYELLGRALEELHPEQGSVFDVIERLLHIAFDYAEKHTDFCRIYQASYNGHDNWEQNPRSPGHTGRIIRHFDAALLLSCNELDGNGLNHGNQSHVRVGRHRNSRQVIALKDISHQDGSRSIGGADDAYCRCVL